MSRVQAYRTLLVDVPADLHPDTAELVITFASALAGKLNLSEIKHGFANEWKTMDWREECLRQLVLHIEKGDPLDVAAYAAFCWARGWLTALPRAAQKPDWWNAWERFKGAMVVAGLLAAIVVPPAYVREEDAETRI